MDGMIPSLKRSQAMQTRTKMFIATVAALLVFILWREYSPAQGEAAKPAATVGRYQISGWGFEGAAGRVISGAHIIDTETGDVYMVPNDTKPVFVGAVPKK